MYSASYNVPSFSKVAGDHDFWGIILEKAWAKIHGEYMVTTGGWQTAVWTALTAAPSYSVRHSSISVSDLYDKIEDMLAKGWPIGCATLWNKEKNLVGGHAYSAL